MSQKKMQTPINEQVTPLTRRCPSFLSLSVALAQVAGGPEVISTARRTRLFAGSGVPHMQVMEPNL